MYNPQQLIEEYKQVEHGKSRIAAIRSAIRMADEHHDLTYQLGFRLALCWEADFYGDTLDMMIVFPELLALIDKHPDIPTAPGIFSEEYYKNGMECVLYVYKWVIYNVDCYYQIPLDDCLNYFEDYKSRCISYGFNLKSYYKELYYFYQELDEEYSEQCFHEYRKLPRDKHGDCKACDRNVEIDFYLDKDNLEMADKLAVEIENFTLTCGGGDESNSAWLRMKSHYLSYYLGKKDFENARRYIRQIESNRNNNQRTEYDYWDEYLYCYSYLDIGKALKIYKEHWKELYEERCPSTSFWNDLYVCIFFKELGKARKGDTVKLNLDPSFPLYSKNGMYKISQMEEFYYNRAKDVALKFDKRNGTDSYQKKLEEKLG